MKRQSETQFQHVPIISMRVGSLENLVNRGCNEPLTPILNTTI